LQAVVSEELDVAVVGTGPAGAATALALAGHGLRVGLIEKAEPPRYKTCGGGILRRALALLPLDARAAVERECHVAELVHHGPDLRFSSHREQPIVSMVMRDRFDCLIMAAAEKAGARLFSQVTVKDVVVGPDAVRLQADAVEFRARFVVAADGATSVVARRTHRPELRRVFPALECEVVPAAGDMARFQESARFDFGAIPSGYGWVFPKRDHLSIGVGTTRPGTVSLPGAYRNYLDLLGIGVPEREERHGFMIPCRPRDGMFEVPRVLFVGDAAGLADPVTAEGITGAILSGQLAARAILEGRLNPGPVNAIYRATLEAGLLGELRVARWLAWVFYDCPRLRAYLLRRHGQQMSELMTRVVTGESSYRSALRQPGRYLKLLAGVLSPDRG